MPDSIDREIVEARRRQAEAFAPFDVMALETSEARARANQAAMFFNDRLPAMAGVRDHSVVGEGGPIRVRHYCPVGGSRAGTIFYAHGGGWFACDVDTHDRALRYLAHASALDVVSLDYRLAPDHPYPAALDDCRLVWTWLHRNGEAQGIPTGKVAVAGDSAGANLVLALAIDARDNHLPTPCGLALFYGCFAPGLLTDARGRYGNGDYGLTGERMDWYWSNYLGDAIAEPPPLAAPLKATLRGLPPVYLGAAELDVVTDDSRLLAQRLEDAGVPVELEIWPGATHGVLQMTRDVALARTAMESIARALIDFVGVPRASTKSDIGAERED